MNLKDFLSEWQSASPEIELFTSGSTGKPKLIRASKKRMAASASLTSKYLGLKKGDTALLCLPLDYIAGKMMAVRSIVAGLELVCVEPDGHPLKDVDCEIDFAAMVPLQVYNSLLVNSEKEKLKSIENLIIGGGPVNEELEAQLKNFPNAVWSTYGMTETLSHIALRRISGADASDWYSPLPGVELSLSDDSRLIINAPMVCGEILTTNDIAEFAKDGQHFRIIGRADNVIISGGVKLQIEEIEKSLSPYIDCPFAITKKADNKFGEIVVLLVAASEDQDISDIKRICADMLDAYARPKLIIKTGEIPMTPSGKINRAEAIGIAQE